MNMLTRLAACVVVFAVLVNHLEPVVALQTKMAPITDTVSGSRLPTGRLINPVGETLEFYGRPVDLDVSADGKYLLVKDWKALRVVDVQTMKLVQTIASPGNSSLYGITVCSTGSVLFTNAGHGIHVFKPNPRGLDQPDMPFLLSQTISLPEGSFPCGVTADSDGTTAMVCLSKRNSVAIVDLVAGKMIREINVGIAPFDVKIRPNEKWLVVSNLGGRQPVQGDSTAPSAGTETVVDKRGIANTGSLSVISLENFKVIKNVSTGLHPSSLAAAAESIFVCNTNQDSMTRLILPSFASETWNVKPDKSLPFGSMPSAITPSPDGTRLFVALAGNNAVAVLDLSKPEAERFAGLIPTAWYPGGLVCTNEFLFVANIKGRGARSQRRDTAQGHNSHDHNGTIQRIPLSEISDAATLAQWTKNSKTNSRFPQILRASANASNHPNIAPVPIPNNLGEPSVFKHIIYVIKENRTFDQVFGDVPDARSEPSLCVFPERISPNHHALAKRFGLLDNYYCNGVLSADGHSWSTEGNVTPYLERAFGGFARSYTFGDDPLTYSSSGFIWDHFLDAGLSFRNYGEMDYAEPPAGMKFQEIWKAYKSGKHIEFKQKIGIERIRQYSCRDYPGWNMVIPDVLRMDRFLKEFREYEKNKGLPNLCLVYLPQDHLGGGVTSNAHMADNDLALGRLVEAVSHSEYWKDTLIVVNEDDPQNGYDHIDGHRSLCLVISAYSQPGINHHFFNQTSALRTMLHIFGLQPMNQQDASMPLMTRCFSKDPINLKPYTALDANIALNETAKPKNQQSAVEQRWRQILATVPIRRTGMKTPNDEDNLNRFVWHEVKGWKTPYPTEYSGPHGRGLSSLKLLRDEHSQDD